MFYKVEKCSPVWWRPAFLPPMSGGAAFNLASARASNSPVSQVARPLTYRHMIGQASRVRGEMGKYRSVMICAPRLRSTRAGLVRSSAILAVSGPEYLMFIAVRSVALRSVNIGQLWGGNRRGLFPLHFSLDQLILFRLVVVAMDLLIFIVSCYFESCDFL